MGDARRRVEDAFVDRIGQADEISMPKIAAEVAALVESDPKWKQELQEEMFLQTVYSLGQRLIPHARRQLIETRKAAERQQLRQRGLVQIRFSRPEAKARILWDTIFEMVEGGRQVRLRSMTRDDLLAASSIRSERSNRDATWSEFLASLATRVPIGKNVGDVVTVDEMDALYTKCEQGFRQAK